MVDFPVGYRSPDGELKHFTAPPIPNGWVYAEGHYDYPTGQWIDDEPAKAPKAHKSAAVSEGE